jgi:acyl-CoA hydrolase
MTAPEIHRDADAVAARIIEALDVNIVLGLPLGLGKANRIANALYARAAADRTIRLGIFTALTLEPPSWSSDIERRFVEPLNARLFSGYERLAYAQALRDGALPNNITVSEFFLLAGRWLGVPAAQQAYVSANYTHAARAILDSGVNVIAQLVAKRGDGADARYSLSCNSDITLDLLPALEADGRNFLMVGEASTALPFMGGDAALPADKFDHVLETPGAEPQLFAPPKEPVSQTDHAVGIHAASLVKDGGSLQIGIGSRGDAFTAGLIMRHRDPGLFREILGRLCHGVVPGNRETGPFEAGVYAASEMFFDGFMELYREDILKRPAQDGALVHAGFFLGSEEFYAWLRNLPEAERERFQMRGISFVNELHGEEERKRADRLDARFVNNAMMATLLGEAISDTLEDGRVVSGVGGQYNFVAQAFALDGARSIITLNATRSAKGRRQSRILSNYGHPSIPRHLRDIFVTEYGVADLRGRSDRDSIAAMLSIADAQFQNDLLQEARRSNKVEDGFWIAPERRGNTPQFVSEALRPAVDAGYCQMFPFDSVFTAEERKLLPALALLRDRTASRLSTIRTVISALCTRATPKRHGAEIERMGLNTAEGLKEKLSRRLLAWALEKTDDGKRTPT